MIYVDDAKHKFGRMVMCHMMADSTEELHAMADKIGVSRRWIQHEGKPKEHYDICLSKRALAVNAGAVEVDGREIVRLIIKRVDAARMLREGVR